MNTDDLPGTPLDLKLKCPGCGWGFDLGLRELANVPTPGEERGFTVCSKCLTTFDFRMDGSNLRVLTADVIATLRPVERMAVWHGQYIAWYAQQVNKGMLQ